jgi:hypothetical protein
LRIYLKFRATEIFCCSIFLVYKKIFIIKYKIMNIINWLKSSNRWKHLLGGVLIGIGANSAYCAAYAGLGIASALELKDKLWGGKWDWIDWALTVGGVTIGYLIRLGFLIIL